MITICPQCQLPLAVTAADLRIAQGQVRCGRCAAVFNALASLYEPGNGPVERRGGGAAATPTAESTSGPTETYPGLQQATLAFPQPPEVALADVVVAGNAGTVVIAGTAAPLPQALSVAPVASVPVASPDPEAASSERDWAVDTMTIAELAALVARSNRDEPPDLASIQVAIDDVSDIIVMPSESLEPRAAAMPAARDASARQAGARRSEPSLRWLELEPAHPAPGSLAARLGLQAEADFGARTGTGIHVAATAPVAAAADARQEHSFAEAPGPFAAALDGPMVADATADPALEIAAAAGRARATPQPRWMAPATLVLGLGLAAQIAHLAREALASVPALQQPITRLYASLGRPLTQRWEVGRYEVRQQGVVAEPVTAGTLTVRASIRNGATRPQPTPMLRVTLQDRFGNRLASRDLTPREYGGTTALEPAPMLAPGQRIDAEVSLLDPGGEAVGFELDVCLRRADASISCANDAPAANG